MSAKSRFLCQNAISNPLGLRIFVGRCEAPAYKDFTATRYFFVVCDYKFFVRKDVVK